MDKKSSIHQWRLHACKQLADTGISTNQLDADLLLAHALGVTREWLIAHDNDKLTDAQKQTADKLLIQRAARVPLAYLVGHKEFYGRDFLVSPDTLIPRPETEALIELAKKHHVAGRLLDVGTGSGCLGLTLALETGSKLTVCDISEAALDVARENAKKVGVSRVRFVLSDLMEHWLRHESPKRFDVIAANLPYVDPSWERSPETDHEPSLALFAEDNGMTLIKTLITQTPKRLNNNGYLLLEADPEQHKSICEFAQKYGLVHVETQDYALLLRASY